jgi:hypothetical protein
MFNRKEDSYREEGNGYRINNVPSDVNYNTCSVKYTLNNDFSRNPRAQYKDSTNIHTRRPHMDVNASTNEQRSSGMNCSRPISNQRPYGMGNQNSMNTQRTSNAARPVVKKTSPLGLLIFPIIIVLIILFSVKREATASLIPIIVAVAAIFSSLNKAKRHK